MSFLMKVALRASLRKTIFANRVASGSIHNVFDAKSAQRAKNAKLASIPLTMFAIHVQIDLASTVSNALQVVV